MIRAPLLSNASRPGVAVLGDINIDVLMPIPAYPGPGGEALTERPVSGVGGSAANTAIVLARLGLPVRMIGRVGRDSWGDLALKALAESSVETTLVQRDERGFTGMMFTPVTPDGERTMFGHRGANSHTTPDGFGAEALAGAQYLHLSGYALLELPQREAAMRAAALAGGGRIPIGMDTAWLPAFSAPDQIRSLLPWLTMCILGVEEARVLTESDSPQASALALLEAGVKIVGLKLGREGCLLADATGVRAIPSIPAQALDTTGAGDAFSAGLIYGYLKGMSLPASGVLANALGSLAVGVWGAGTALPGKEEVKRLLEKNTLPESREHREWIEEARRALIDPN